MRKYLICIFALLCIASSLKAQELAASLFDIVKLAQVQSPQFKLAQTRKEVNSYEYINYKSNLKPQISLYGNAPVYSKQYTSVIQPDGSIQFLPVKQNYTNLGFSLSQEIPFSGGQLSLNTELSDFYDFKTRYNQYNGIPIFLKLEQPLFGYNELKWQKKIEPLKLDESNKEYVESLEDIAQQVTTLYFDVLDAKNNISIATNNLSNTESNYTLEKKRINLGTTTEDKILQLELQTLKSSQQLEKAKYDYQITELKLRTLIGKKDNGELNLDLPKAIPVLNINLDKAIEYVKRYNSDYVSFKRKKLEAERDVAAAKAAKQQINIVATFGYNRASESLGTVYGDPKNQQTLALGFNVPLVDWGRRNARYNTAMAQAKLIDYTNESSEASIIQEVTTLVNNIELLKNNISLAQKTDSVANRRFMIANNLYQLGKLTITDLNLAQNEKDDLKRAYFSSLRGFWESYYLLRKLTLFDFEKQVTLYEQ